MICGLVLGTHFTTVATLANQNDENHKRSRPGACSVILGQKHGCYGSVPLGDDPEDCSIRVGVDGQNALAVGGGVVVGFAVFGAHVAPVSFRVALQGGEYGSPLDEAVG